jgi:hypothetical protein
MLAMVVAFAAPSPAGAMRAKSEKPAGEVRIGQCIRAAAGGRQWLEKTLWGLRDQEGGWIGAEVRNSDGSHDLGPLQINSWWVGKIAAVTGSRPERIRWWLANDACFNVDAARWIFLSGLAVTGDYWKAIGVYHSPTGWRQRRYASSVVRHLTRRFGDDVFSPARSRALARVGAGLQ